ncbi:hypothetical protein HOY82DRAFT_552266 [Tuber indicum]|nr:hypothetical protein HOY82DRAFT_552266 [Tuber indicum]
MSRTRRGLSNAALSIVLLSWTSKLTGRPLSQPPRPPLKPRSKPRLHLRRPLPPPPPSSSPPVDMLTSPDPSFSIK